VTALAIAFVVVICCCASAAVGIILHIKLPDDHFDTDSKDVMKSVMSIVATIAALVLGLLIASAKNSYDTQIAEMEQLATNIVQLDRILILYGPETRGARALLKQTVTATHDRIWPTVGYRTATLDPSVSEDGANIFYDMVTNLSPTTDAQRRAQSAALQLTISLTQTRMLMFEQTGGSISWPLLAVLISWISVLFLGFGLLARLHVTIAVTMIVGALSVASAIFLMLELSQPYQGFMRVSDLPLQTALARIGR
jgi:hypothetical protein